MFLTSSVNLLQHGIFQKGKMEMKNTPYNDESARIWSEIYRSSQVLMVLMDEAEFTFGRCRKQLCTDVRRARNALKRLDSQLSEWEQRDPKWEDDNWRNPPKLAILS